LTLTVDVVDRLPASDTLTQYVPGFTVAVSCAAEPATADDVEFVTEHAPLLAGPIPSPSALVVDGETDVSVTPTFPAAVTVNVKTTAPPGASEPLKESLVGPGVEGEGVVESAKGLVHAAELMSTAASRNA
jgi:hypothetical protein